MLHLPFIKCTKCGKTTLEDEYRLTGCQHCHSTTCGVDLEAFNRRDSLQELEGGTTVFQGRYRKIGNLHYAQKKSYVLVENIKCGIEGITTNHAYITDVSPNTITLLRSLKPGTHIQFKANVHKYTDGSNKWGLDHMKHVTTLTN